MTITRICSSVAADFFSIRFLDFSLAMTYAAVYHFFIIGEGYSHDRPNTLSETYPVAPETNDYVCRFRIECNSLSVRL
jgi:hypothetical protein